MIRHGKDLKVEIHERMKGGIGALQNSLLLHEGEFHGKGRLFSHSLLKPGDSVGVHTHENDFEVYYILRGQGIYTDDDATYPVGPGDVTICEDGHQHGLVNTGKENLEYIALILFTK